ncbi:hypothetical protein [Acinetobacter indicus]|uniref:hypothetical protein n=1 Tax=Acinetobacter indicus TaxID=756892 RepID=UPI002577251D|nr:hypothetical protein [Acinetobacter indicus]MDM1328910.1 hypothetical protein [Acinetobacter indicus]
MSSADKFIEEWFTLLENSSNKKPAITVYQGRTVNEILRAQKYVNAEIIFLSAGLGIVRENDLIPNYDLTISEGSNSLKKLLSKWDIDEYLWWKKLSNKSDNYDLLTPIDGYIFIALPHAYLQMIIPILINMDKNKLKNIRLFLHPISYQSLPEILKPYYMPYDYRVDNSDFAGTKVDYCQRCLHHFIKYIHTPNQDIADAINAVEAFMQNLPPIMPKPKRIQLKDDEIKLLILEGWDTCKGQSSKLLRYLRDHKNVACEQSRFQGLWRSIKNEQDNEKQ